MGAEFDNNRKILPSIAMPEFCEALTGQASPNGRWIAIQINCEAGGYIQVLDFTSGEVLNLGVNNSREGQFLEWITSEDELLILIHGLLSNEVYKVNMLTQVVERLDVPENVYDLTMSPSRQRIIYSTTQGIGFGSETWLANVDGTNARRIFDEPEHLVIFPRWAPDETALAYIRLQDSSTPFVTGELLLADHDGSNSTVLSTIDAGHGYYPTWSPDSRFLAFVKRENPNDELANIEADKLISNVYVLDVQVKMIKNTSGFSETLVEQPIWSPDGKQLAFGVKGSGKTGLWQFDLPTNNLQQVVNSDILGAPLWLTNPKSIEDSK